MKENILRNRGKQKKKKKGQEENWHLCALCRHRALWHDSDPVENLLRINVNRSVNFFFFFFSEKEKAKHKMCPEWENDRSRKRMTQIRLPSFGHWIYIFYKCVYMRRHGWGNLKNVENGLTNEPRKNKTIFPLRIGIDRDSMVKLELDLWRWPNCHQRAKS